MPETIRVKVADDYALTVAKRLQAVGAIPEAVCVEILIADRAALVKAARAVARSPLQPEVGYVVDEEAFEALVAALAECGIEDSDDELAAACPSCGALVADLDGFGVLIHDECGYCSHPDSYGGQCQNCGASA